MKYFIVFIWKRMGDIRWEWENGLTDKHPIQWLHDMQTRSDKLVDKKKKNNRTCRYEIYKLLWFTPISDDIKIPEEFELENTFL